MADHERPSVYSPSPSFAYYNALIENTPSRTGKTLPEWVEILNQYGPPDEKSQQTWLKKEYSLSINHASLVVAFAHGRGVVEAYNPEAYVEKMFSGKKMTLLPLYESLLKIGLSIAHDVRACPCETIVPFYRNHVFAQLKPSTNTRIDLGLALKNTPVPGRLIDTGGYLKKDRITHRIPISDANDIDDTLVHWLRFVYELDGKKTSA